MVVIARYVSPHVAAVVVEALSVVHAYEPRGYGRHLGAFGTPRLGRDFANERHAIRAGLVVPQATGRDRSAVLRGLHSALSRLPVRVRGRRAVPQPRALRGDVIVSDPAPIRIALLAQVVVDGAAVDRGELTVALGGAEGLGVWPAQIDGDV